MADRGFLIKELLIERHVKLFIPPFLGSRHRFNPQEEALTKDIAKHRIHVERSIERMKNCADPEGGNGGPDPPPGKLQKYRFP